MKEVRQGDLELTDDPNDKHPFRKKQLKTESDDSPKDKDIKKKLKLAKDLAKKLKGKVGK